MSTNENSPGANPGAISPEPTTSNHHSTDGSADSTAESRCQRCKKGLSKPESIARCHGPVCWTRRHEAAVRLPQLDCGCADPWTCRHSIVPALSDNQIDGYADAARYILETTGCTPILPLDVVRALYRRGGQDRALAEKLRTAGAVA